MRSPKCPDESEAWDVLIVAFEPGTREELELVTRAYGYRVACCRDRRAALDEMRKRAPRMVVVELTLPGMEGLALCRSIRSGLRYHDLPILCLSGLTCEERDLPALLDRRFKARFLPKGALAEAYLSSVESAIGPPRDQKRGGSTGAGDVCGRRRDPQRSAPVRGPTSHFAASTGCRSFNVRNPSRVSKQYCVEFPTVGDFLSEYDHNIAFGGLFVKSAELPTRDEVVTVNLLIPGQDEIALEARVVYLVSAEQAGMRGGDTGFGVELIDMSQDRRRSLQELVRSIA